MIKNKTFNKFSRMVYGWEFWKTAMKNECRYPDPLKVHVDFEKAMIEALKNIIGNHITIKGCFYHLTQNTHKNILGLEHLYKNDDKFSLFCRKLDSLAFLPKNRVLEGINFLRTIMPHKATDLVNYFDSMYLYPRILQMCR